MPVAMTVTHPAMMPYLHPVAMPVFVPITAMMAIAANADAEAYMGSRSGAGQARHANRHRRHSSQCNQRFSDHARIPFMKTNRFHNWPQLADLE